MYKNETDIMVRACKLGFSVSFEKCKEMAWTYLPTDDAESLRVDFSNKSLKTMISYSLGRFVRVSDSLMSTNKIDSTVQTEEDDIDEGHSRANRREISSYIFFLFLLFFYKPDATLRIMSKILFLLKWLVPFFLSFFMSCSKLVIQTPIRTILYYS